MEHVQLAEYAGNFRSLNRTTQLVREDGIRAFLLHLREGEEMPEHKVKDPITVQCLHGSVLFKTAEDEADLIPGSLLSLPGAVPHLLRARTASLLLVTVPA